MLTEEEIVKIYGEVPVGDYCYGSPLADKGMLINEAIRYQTRTCPYWRPGGYCKLLKYFDDALLADQVKCCEANKYFYLFYRSDSV